MVNAAATSSGRGGRSDEQLAAAAADGSVSSFEALVDRLGPRLLRYLTGRVRDAHAAEDLVQETFLRAYRHLDRYDPSRSFSTWLFTIATRLAISHWRAKRAHVPADAVDPPAPAEDGPAEIAGRRERDRGLWATARRLLSDDQYTALWFRYAEDMPVRDVAEVMGKSLSNAKVLLHRAHKRMLRHMAPAEAGVRNEV